MGSFEPLATRTFTMADQNRFAAISGDYNPMHVDRAAARKLQAGVPAVHGVAVLLWALEELCAHTDHRFAVLEARFERFVAVDRAVDLYLRLDEARARIEVRRDGKRLATITVRFGEQKGLGESSLGFMPVAALGAAPADLDFDAAASASGSFRLADTDVAGSYPVLAQRLGVHATRSIVGLSALVGMVAPGLHSIFAFLHVSLDSAQSEEAGVLRYAAIEQHPSYSFVKYRAEGPGVRATIEAFVRPAPAVQPSLEEIAKSVDPRQFAHVRALITGGSRGLGEVTAKTIAAGGGTVCITYALGQVDAERLCRGLQDAGADCTAIHYDALLSAAPQLAAVPFRPNQIYHFATPQIGRQREHLFSERLLAEFVRFYCSALHEICQLYSGGETVRVFNPSTVFIDTPPRDLSEYVMAKAASEILSAAISKGVAGVDVVAHRLPRLATDQNTGLIAHDFPPIARTSYEIVEMLSRG